MRFLLLIFLLARPIFAVDFEAFKEALVPVFSSSGVYRQGDFPTEPDKLFLLVYDRDDREEVKAWFDQNREEVLRDERPHLHLLFPGGVSFLAPTSVIQKKVGGRIREAMEETRQRVGEKAWKILSEKPVLYYLDRKKSIIRQLGIEDGFHLYSIDFSAGTLEEVFWEDSQPANPKTSDTNAIMAPTLR